MSKRAVILAGGMGTRLKPYTVALPKPLVPLGNSPILEIVIKQLASSSFDHITLAVNHQADIIRSFFNDGKKWNIKIDYSMETKPIGTIAPLKMINDLPDNFLVMNGDLLTDIDYDLLYNEHITKENIFTIASYKQEHKLEYGVLEVNDNKLVGFQEKPVSNICVSMGIYMVNKSILEIIPDNQPFGFDNLMETMLKLSKTVNVFNHSGKWFDIGTADDYNKATLDFENNPSDYIKE